MITDEDIKQWKPLVCKIANRYIYNPYKLDIDDIEQIGCIGLLRGLNTFDESKNIKLKTYLFHCIKWAIDKEIEYHKKLKRVSNYNTSSLDIPVGEDNETTLGELIEDTGLRVEEDVIQSILMDRYRKEIMKTLQDPKDRLFAILLLIHDLSIENIANRLNLNLDIARKKNKSIKEKLRRNMFIKSRWHEFFGRKYESVNYYGNVEYAVIDNIYIQSEIMIKEPIMKVQQSLFSM